MPTFESTAIARCRPSDVIGALRDGGGSPQHLVPVPIDVETRRGGGLRRGTSALVVAHLAGHALRFDVEILAAGPRGLRIEAAGPFEVELVATFRAQDRSSTEIASRFTTGGKPRSFADRLFLHAGEGMLAGGALDLAAHQLAARAESWARDGGAGGHG